MSKGFIRENGDLVYNISSNEKFTIWINEEDNVEIQLIYNEGDSSYQDDLLDERPVCLNAGHLVKGIKRIERVFKVELIEPTSEDVEYLLKGAV